MSKRIIALLLCAVMLVPCFVGCAEQTDDDDPGAYITMYLGNDFYDFDPANAYYNNDALNVVSLLFDTLFTLTDSGKVEKSLVKKYTIKEDAKNDEFYMELTLNTTYWSNGERLDSDDVLFAWKRLLNNNNDYAAASLLYDIKNARAAKENYESIDDIGVEAITESTVKITFEGPIDYDQFLLNLTSVATAPLYENYVADKPDWAKKPSSMVTSGAYKIGKIFYKTVVNEENGRDVTQEDDYLFDQYGNRLTVTDRNGNFVSYKSGTYDAKDINYFYLERNNYYYRTKDEAIDKTVKNYRLLVDCSKTDEEILADYKDGKLFYIGNIPLSIRDDAFVAENVEISNALSTFVLYLNETALIDNGTEEGETLFADTDVRNALSLAIDRDAIQKAIVYAEAATGLVCPGVFNAGSSNGDDFRTVGGKLIETSAKVAQAKALLEDADIDASKYTFTIKVAAYDDVNVKITEMVAEAWTSLGFNVTVEKLYAIENNDVAKELASAEKEDDRRHKDICDDVFIEALQRNEYEVIAFDYNAFSADAWSMLSSFANSFSGMHLVEEKDEDGNPVYSLTPHSTGYNSEEYNDLMEAIYYIPYFASITEEQLADETFIFLSIYKDEDKEITAESHARFLAVYNKVKAIYEANGITPSTDSDDWTDQKAVLLHKAEELLMEDMPVIPVLFLQDAVLVSDSLSKVSSTYYAPASFYKAKLDDYSKYSEAFASFPEIDWTLVK